MKLDDVDVMIQKISGVDMFVALCHALKGVRNGPVSARLSACARGSGQAFGGSPSLWICVLRGYVTCSQELCETVSFCR